MKYILCADQGGTKTDVIIADAKGNLLGYGQGPGAYHTVDGSDAATAAIKIAADKAFKESGVTSSQIEIAVAGMTGMDWESDRAVLKNVLEDATGVQNILVYNDCIIAMYGGTLKKTGIVLCAGTGLNVAVKGPDGEESLLGFYIRDEDQGGSALARRAIQRTFFSDIGLCDKTELTPLFCKQAKVSTVEDLLKRYYTDEEFSQGIKQLVPDIIEVSKHDAVAGQLINEFSFDLSRYVYAGLRMYNMLESDADVVFSGSVLKGQDNPLTEKIAQHIKKFAPHVSIVDAKYPPVIGAYLYLFTLKKIESFQNDQRSILNNIDLSAKRWGLFR